MNEKTFPRPGRPDVRIVGLQELDACDPVSAETVVVVDVIFAFTVASLVLASGAAEIQCVETVDGAWNAAAHSDAPFLMGEVSGRAPPGFDAGNSPTELSSRTLVGRSVIQRTRFGTRGLARCSTAQRLFAAAAVNAKATASHVGTECDGPVLVVPTGTTSEDHHAAVYLAELICGGNPEPTLLADAVLSAAAEHQALWERNRDATEFAQFLDDVSASAQVDSLDVVLEGTSNQWGVVLRLPPR